MNEKKLAEITKPGDGFLDAPVLDIFAERPNSSRRDPEGQDAVLVYVWCDRCLRAHQHGMLSHDYRVQHRAAHCTDSTHVGRVCPSYRKTGYFIKRNHPVIQYHSQNGVTAPVLRCVGYDSRGRVIAPCPFCLKSHRHHVVDEFTLKNAHCSKVDGGFYFIHDERDMMKTNNTKGAIADLEPTPIDHPRDIVDATIQYIDDSQEYDPAHILLHQTNRVHTGVAQNFDDEVVFPIEMTNSIAPKDAIEGMMSAQMIALHNLAMDCASKAVVPNQPLPARDMNLSHAVRLMNAFVNVSNALDKHRGKGQTITVKHQEVNVKSGGQAVIGDVHHEGGVSGKYK